MILLQPNFVRSTRSASEQLRMEVRVAMLLGLMTFPSIALPQGQAMSEADDSKPVQIVGCMSARTKGGGIILSGVFGRPVTVIGPNYLLVGLGHQVTLTGSWQRAGLSPASSPGDEPKLFVATAVKVTSRQCAAPPSAAPRAVPSVESKKNQR